MTVWGQVKTEARVSLLGNHGAHRGLRPEAAEAVVEALLPLHSRRGEKPCAQVICSPAKRQGFLRASKVAREAGAHSIWCFCCFKVEQT